MKIEASVDEADIGQVRKGQEVLFSVDAYPTQTFEGVVQQIQLQPVTLQNVVTYTVEILVDNPELKLMPGMTATLEIIISSEENKLTLDWEVDKNKKTILMPGRLTAWKGQETFIEALNLVNKELGYKSFNAVILGSDQGRDIYTKKIKRLAEQYRLTSQLKFIEHCKNMPLAYKISDIVVSASV